MPSCEELFKEIKLNFPHYCYYNKALKAKGFICLSLYRYPGKDSVCMLYVKHNEKIKKSLCVELIFDDEIVVFDSDDFRKVFEGETLKKAWNKMCGDEEILKKFSEFESL